MKQIVTVLALVVMMGCQQEQTPSPQPQPVAPVYHTIVEKFYSASTLHIYRTINGIDGNGLLTTVGDTVYQANTQVTFQIERPAAGSYYFSPAITENWMPDTCSVELWIDGVMVEQQGGIGGAAINYQW